MSLLHKVQRSLKWKKSDVSCARKLGLTLEKYREIKHEILSSRANQVVEFKEDMDAGSAEIRGIASSEPRSPEEIIRVLKIDTSQWKLSSYWNKQHKDHWVVSAFVTRIVPEPQVLLENTLKNFNPAYEPSDMEPRVNEGFSLPVAGIISIQDLHFGKEGNSTIVNDFKEAITYLVMRAYKSHHVEKVIYVIGGDLLNMDTFLGQTTKGTPVDNDQRAQEAYDSAFDCLFWSINFIKEFCHELQVVYLPGNHDRLSSYHMAHALGKVFENVPGIVFDAGYAERKVVTYGDNFFGFEHGDVSTKNTALVYATEFPKEWGSTVYRTCYTGHWHRKKTMEYVTEDETHGFALKQLPSLSRPDYWHYHNKYTGSKRQAVMEMHDRTRGKVSEFIYTA